MFNLSVFAYLGLKIAFYCEYVDKKAHEYLFFRIKSFSTVPVIAFLFLY